MQNQQRTFRGKYESSAFVVVVIVLTVITDACCLNRIKRTEPERPQTVAGWKAHKNQGLLIIGEFALKKGESTDNGNLRLSILDMKAPDSCAEPQTFASHARVRIRFTRLSDETMLCEDLIAEGTSGNAPYECVEELAELGITGLEIEAINVTEGWVYLRLYSALP